MSARLVTMESASELLRELPKPILHLKGFGKGICRSGVGRPDNEAAVCKLNGRAMQSALDHMLALPVRTLVWDGDDQAEDSFTSLIPQLKHRMPTLRLIAFKYDSEVDSFHSSWAHTGLDPLLITVPSATTGCMDWTPEVSADLGFRALKATGSTNVLCIGGGDTVKIEHEKSKSLRPMPKFSLVPVKRVRQGIVQESSLIDIPDIHVI